MDIASSSESSSSEQLSVSLPLLAMLAFAALNSSRRASLSLMALVQAGVALVLSVTFPGTLGPERLCHAHERDQSITLSKNNVMQRSEQTAASAQLADGGHP